MKSDLSSYSSSVGRPELHVCFKVKYCHKVFESEPIRARCEQIFRGVAERHGIIIKEMGFDEDHVHMVVRLNPSMSVAGMAKLFKGTSGHMLLKEFPYMKSSLFWGSGLWSPAVYFDSLGQQPEQISDYVRNQGSY
jgi:putative transposase